MIHFLPENIKRDRVDILLVSGDIYIDHPSFGVSIIARVLENEGYSVCIVSQPEYYEKNYLEKLPDVSLFIGITSGNLDSTVSNYTSNRTVRKKDAYSLDGNPFFYNGKKKRPDRATIFYTNFVKTRYKTIPIILGGIEASLRKVVHYDYIQQKIRNSILIDSKADMIVYSMGEKAVIEIARRIKNNDSLLGIRGTVHRINEDHHIGECIELPSYSEIVNNPKNLLLSTRILEDNIVWDKSKKIIQKNENASIIIYPPHSPLDTNELDKIYALPFKKDFPEYCYKVPAWNMIKDSVTAHRGCFGRCSFCAISLHQGPVIVSRSKESISDEINNLIKKNFFKGNISDIGGPTANMYGIKCKINWCKSPKCLFPRICNNLVINQEYYELLVFIKESVKNINKIFISSGLRHDIALLKKNETEWIINNCISGHLKIAPEHTDDKTLKLMKKPRNNIFNEFIIFFNNIKKKYDLDFYLLPYLILSFPGSTIKSVKKMGFFLKKNKINTYQYQDFTPTPSTMATAMYFCGKDENFKKINIPKVSSKKNNQRKVLEYILKKS